MSEQLKPCPFCGGKAHTYIGGLMDVGYLTEKEAIEAWNRRKSNDK